MWHIDGVQVGRLIAGREYTRDRNAEGEGAPTTIADQRGFDGSNTLLRLAS